MASCSSSASGRSLRGQAREIVYNVAKHLREQKELHNLMYNVVQSTSEATGISQSSVKRILAEARSHLAKGKLKFSTPTKKKSSNVTKIIVDDFTKCVIRRKIHDFYINRKTVPTLKKLNRLLKDEDILHCGREYLRKLLKSMGFKWKRCQSSRKILMEKPENVAWRARYLREIRQHRYNKRNIVYLDETYIHSTLSVPSCWQSETEIGSAKATGKGRRLIIIHAGGECGFVKNALLIFQSQQKSGDYHDDMNYENFSKWVQNMLIPNLPPNSVVVMDNASYHSVQENKKPTSSSIKQSIMDWLRHNNVAFQEPITKAELLLLVKYVQTKPTYRIDKLFVDAGHTVVRLPPYHPDLSPIELVWGDVKGSISECLSESLEVKRKLCEKLFLEYSVDKWKKCCDHVIKIENEYWKNDGLMDEAVDELIISINGESSDSDFSSSESETSATDIE